jgi:hypothetical protein
MSLSDSLGHELEVLKDLSMTIAERLDGLSAFAPAEKRHLVRILRAQALSLGDMLDEVAGVPPSARARRSAA